MYNKNYNVYYIFISYLQITEQELFIVAKYTEYQHNRARETKRENRYTFSIIYN